MSRRSLPLLSTLLLAVLGGSVLAAAQKPADPAPPTTTGFGETIEVNVVNVEVFVTDKKGQRISGLTRDDFEILEDGRPAKITNFFAVEGGKTLGESPDLLAPLPTAEPGVAAPPLTAA
jgi:hypothetical protein